MLLVHCYHIFWQEAEEKANNQDKVEKQCNVTLWQREILSPPIYEIGIVDSNTEYNLPLTHTLFFFFTADTFIILPNYIRRHTYIYAVAHFLLYHSST